MTGPHRDHVEVRASRTAARQFVSDSHDHKPDAPDRIIEGFTALLDRIAAKDADKRAAVRAEIQTNGTWWAASEILRLREDLARARAAARGAA